MVNMKKMLALLLAVVMVMGMIPFGAMAEEAESVTHIETCLEDCADEACACECHKSAETPAEEPKQEEPAVDPASLEEPKTEETPVVEDEKTEETPVVEDQKTEETPVVEDEKTEETPVVEDEKTEETPVCTCTPVEGVHAEECALSAKTEVSEEKKDDVAPVDYAALYESIMNCNDLFEADAMVDALTEEQLAAFEGSLTEEQSSALDAHYESLITAFESSRDEEAKEEEEAEEEDTRETRYPTHNMTNVAPFGDPAVGTAPQMFRMFRSASPATLAEETDNGLEVRKTADESETEGEFILTLEAWATGAKVTTEQMVDAPTDIILVLDQSGSMANNFDSVAFRTVSGTPSELYSNRNTLYVERSDGGYEPVSVTRRSVQSASNYTLYSGESNYTYYDTDNLYHKCSDEIYNQITVTRSGTIGNRTYSYKCSQCGDLGTSSGAVTEPGFSSTFYRVTYTSEYQYTFSYVNEEGTTVTESVMASAAAPDWDFYESYSSGSVPRLDALKDAVSQFTSEVARKQKGADGILGNDDDVNHRIAIVGFSSEEDFGNTEILTGCNITQGSRNYGTNKTSIGGNTCYFPTGYTQNGVQYNSTGYSNACASALVSPNSQSVSDAINALTAYGATEINCGLQMAADIFEEYPLNANEKRQRVVIVFTDGSPTAGSGFQDSVANAAIAKSNTLKTSVEASGYGADVYTVGIFDGADANLSSGLPGTTGTTNKSNRFMHLTSSNYLTATSLTNTGSINPDLDGNSYYLSANNASALSSIFRQISENIAEGGSTTTLNESTVVKDIIADSFMLPVNADKSSIKVYTDGVNSTTGAFNDTPEAFQNAQVTISGRELNITNFNFSENWVGSETAADGTVTYRGQKLIIEIPIVPNPDFLGGNNVPTNGSASGVYSGGELIEAFPEPDVDVDIKVLEIGLATTDQNIYLTNDADLAALVTSLDHRINGSNNAYVDIKYEIKDGETVIGTVTIPAGGTLPATITWTQAEGQDMTPNLDAFDTKNYTIVATASPTSEGTYDATTNEKIEPVNVFKPVVYFQDSEINAGATPAYATENYVKVEWKNGTTLASSVTMRGTEPQLVYTYDPVAAPLNAESEVQITAVATTDQKTISLNNVTFIRNACNLANGCGHVGGTVDMTKDGYINFIVHLKTCDLVITKAVDKLENAADTFIFTVAGPNGFSKTVVINGAGSVTIADLPIGAYTVTEDTAWSWRYACSASSITKTIAPNNNTFEFTNTFNPDSKWLTDTSYAKNLFGSTSAVIK